MLFNKLEESTGELLPVCLREFGEMLLIVFTYGTTLLQETIEILPTQIANYLDQPIHPGLGVIDLIKALIYHVIKGLETKRTQIAIETAVGCYYERMAHGQGLGYLLCAEADIAFTAHCFCDQTEVGINIRSMIEIDLSPFSAEKFLLEKRTV